MPGVAGCSDANFVHDMILVAHRYGYDAACINSMATLDDAGLREYRVLDFSDSEIITQSIK